MFRSSSEFDKQLGKIDIDFLLFFSILQTRLKALVRLPTRAAFVPLSHTVVRHLICVSLFNLYFLAI